MDLTTMKTERPRAILAIGRVGKRRMLAKTSLSVALALLIVAPVAAQSQAAKRYRIGFLGLSSAADYAPGLQAFHQGLRDLGYEEGKNISIEYRWAQGRDERLPLLAVELVRLTPDVLVTHATPGIRAARQATTTIPIVMGVSSDPVRLGFVKSLARPGGNTTGVATLQIDLAAKRLELFKEVVPTLRHVAVLWNATNSALREDLTQMELASVKLGVRLRPFELAREPTALETVFAAILRERPHGLILVADALAATHSSRIAEFAVRNRLPAMGGWGGFVADGGLVSYSGDFREGWRVAARYVDRILKGAKPAELPVEQPSKFDLVAARALGLVLHSVGVKQAAELDTAFASLARERGEALSVISDTFVFANRRLIQALAAQYRVPAIYPGDPYVEAGGLMAFGPSTAAAYHRAAYFVDRILRGARPADRPVEQPTKFELTINLNTAKALGITFPSSILLRADRVIE